MHLSATLYVCDWGRSAFRCWHQRCEAAYEEEIRVEHQLSTIGRVGHPTVVAKPNTFFDPTARYKQGDAKRGCGDAQHGYSVVYQ